MTAVDASPRPSGAHPDGTDVTVMGRTGGTYGEQSIAVVPASVADCTLPRELIARAMTRSGAAKVLEHVIHTDLTPS